MTNLRKAVSKDGTPGKKGSMGNPYDTKLHNTCRYSGETEDIKQYWVKLTVTGTNLDYVEALVWQHYNGKEVELARRSSQKVAAGQPFLLQGPDMMKALMIEQGEGRIWKFEYATQQDGFVWFPFGTEDSGSEGYGYSEGYGFFAESRDKKQLKDDAPYCKDETVDKVRTIVCSFPAW